MDINTDYTSYDKERTVLGAKNGYLHLWKEAETTGMESFSLHG